MDVSVFQNRLEKMVQLPSNWDGWGSVPICQKVYDISRQILDLLASNLHITSLKLFVGVDVQGSLLIDLEMGIRNIEMTILPDGQIEYEEYQTGKNIGSGSFYLSKTTLDSILS